MRARDDGGNSGRDAEVYSADRVRQVRIVLNTPARRAIFVAGLVGIVILALVAAIEFRWS
jgi:hypothetical protein